MQALMVGCGNMGGSLLKRWAADGSVNFTVVDPATTVSLPGVTHCKSAGDIPGDAFDLLVVGLKPQLIDKVVPGYAEWLNKDAAVLSIAAGYASDRLSALLGGRPVIRVMPNMPASIGRGVSGLYATSSVSQAARKTVLELMTATGEVVEVGHEDDLDKVTAIAGSGPGYVFEIARAYVEAARSLGFDDEDARRLVLATLGGAVEMALQTGEPLDALRNAVTSKAGTTEAGLKALNGEGDLSRLLKATALAAYSRAVELR